jgi:hypothetical protein
MIMPMMTHQPGATTTAGIDLHLGQKPKLGGRYGDDSLIFLLLFLFLFLLSKTQKDQNISVVSRWLSF